MRKLLLVSILAFSHAASAAEVVVNYACDVPGYDLNECSSGAIIVLLPSLSLGGITVTGSGVLHFQQLNGLGVVGGNSDDTIDSGETVTFSFENGPVTGVTIHTSSQSSINAPTVEVFGIGGSSLGTFAFPPSIFNVDISSMVGFAEITSFRVSDSGFYRPNRVRYLPPPVEQLEDLAGLVLEINMSVGISNSLDTKLDNALRALDDTNVQNDGVALNSMYAFCSSVEAQRGKKISDAQADQLIGCANAVIEALDPFALPCN